VFPTNNNTAKKDYTTTGRGRKEGKIFDFLLNYTPSIPKYKTLLTN